MLWSLLEFPPFYLWRTRIEPWGQVICSSGFLLPFCTMLSPCTNVKRTASQAFEDPEPPILKAVLQLTLHIALSPMQVQALLDQRAILPDPYSSRFGLRSDPRPLKGHIMQYLHHKQKLRSSCAAKFTSPGACPNFATSRASWTRRWTWRRPQRVFSLQRIPFSYIGWQDRSRRRIGILPFCKWISGFFNFFGICGRG